MRELDSMALKLAPTVNSGRLRDHKQIMLQLTVIILVPKQFQRSMMVLLVPKLAEIFKVVLLVPKQ